jgi:Phenylpropionate dioxygenase and related ring-hydroxylating dioxygenases, large terminal subunit
MERSLPRDAYRAESFFEKEKERVFFRDWFYVGREEALAKPGDYLLVDVAGESIFVVRTRAGDLKGHYNVCRHRGSQLSFADSKPAECASLSPTGCFGGAITCPYHAWSFGLDGCLNSAPFLNECDEFKKEELSLYPVGVETWGGFVFVNLTPDQAERTLLEQLGVSVRRVENYPLADLRVAKRIVYTLEANWKVVAENYNECYHCGGVHPELCKIVPAFKQKGGFNLDWEHGIPQADGTFTFTFSGKTDRAPFPGLSEIEKVRHKGELIYPNMMMSLSCDHVATFMLLPQGPSKTTVVCDFLFHPSEIEKASFDPSDAVEFWDLVNKQDWEICQAVQRGMQSRVFEYGFYAPMEDASLDIRRYLAERMGEL